MASTGLVRVVFGLLVIATVGAFFITQRLKRSSPLLSRVFVQRHLSPNDDGRKDRALVGFRLPERDDVTVSIVDQTGEEIRRLADDRPLAAGPHRFVWDGRTDAGRRAPEGGYQLRVALRSKGRSVTYPQRVIVDTTPPRPELLAVSPSVLYPSAAGRLQQVRVRFEGPSLPPPVLRVYRTDGGGAREVARFSKPPSRPFAIWNARIRGRPAPEGTYAFAVTVRDGARNAGSAPVRLPPAAASAREGTGLTVDHLSAAGPLEPVAAGRRVRLSVGPGRPRWRWALTRSGSRRPLARGRGAGSLLVLRVPRGARTGLHLVEVAARDRRVRVPLVVRAAETRPRGRRGAAAGTRPPPVLVVLPSLTWQGLNPVDDDADGFADTLDRSSAVRAGRAFAGDGLPGGLRSEVAPLLRFLDAAPLPYDLTTDLALARSRGPRLERYAGVAFAGSERWLTAGLDLRLRDYVDGGGRVASFGADAFRRRVSLTAALLRDPSPPEPTNVFGERTGPLEIAPAPMVVFSDPSSLFAGTDGFVGLFRRFEQSESRVAGAQLLTIAGREPRRPAFTSYRLGRGVVVRIGTAEWNRTLAQRSDTAAVTRRIWALLSD